ncbi:MAG: sulfatase-like hydrolase/transferase [Marinilabiliaceae bacterium]|nr:sulfatase-like hydrolase/transferase [Marinilabiliaceae bacterium]
MLVFSKPVSITTMLAIFFIIFGCNEDCNCLDNNNKTQNQKIIILVLDGIRYSETYNENNYLSFFNDSIKQHGVSYSNFYNLGSTYTTAGHTAITTGHYQQINNSGEQLPDSTSIFQYWLKNFNKSRYRAWIITSKSKLEVLGNTSNPTWHNIFLPLTSCGVKGLGSANRPDSLTMKEAISVLTDYEPEMVLINLMEPDIYGHQGNWDNYINAIKRADSLTHKLWTFINTNASYKNSTTLFITNDHGRHLDSIANGFIGHGDNCEGCKHIQLFVFGPKIKKGVIIDSLRSLIDIAPTITHIFNFDIPYLKGKNMQEIFITE